MTLEDLYRGAKRGASVKRRVVCRGCKDLRQGSAEFQEKCGQCVRCPPEVRMVNRPMGPGFMVQQQERVPSKDFCKDDMAKLEAVIERGMPDGAKISFERMSEQMPGQIPGDVHLVLRQQPHKRFERRGDDLYTDIKVSLRDALAGFSTTLEHLDGRAVSVRAGEARSAGARPLTGALGSWVPPVPLAD